MTYQFVVSLSTVPSATVSFDYATTGNTSIGGASCSGSTDFIHSSGTLSIVPPATSKNISITVCSEGLAEPDESFSVVLTNPINSVLSDGSGEGVIFDDDSLGFTGGDFVKEISPQNQSIGVSTNTAIVIEFNRDMCQSTVLDANNIRLSPVLLGPDVAGSRAYNPLTRTLVFTPFSHLSILTTYQVQVRNTQSMGDDCNLSTSLHDETFTTGF